MVVKTMPNVKILAASRYSKGGQGEYPVRFVVLRWTKGSGHEFSSHMQVKDGVHPNYFISGRYYHTYNGAFNSAVARVMENRRDFKPGNVSHVPAFADGELVHGHAAGLALAGGKRCRG